MFFKIFIWLFLAGNDSSFFLKYHVVCFQSSMDAPEAWTPPFNFGMLRVVKDVKENSPEDHIIK